MPRKKARNILFLNMCGSFRQAEEAAGELAANFLLSRGYLPTHILSPPFPFSFLVSLVL